MKLRILNFWNKLLTNSNKLSGSVYQLVLKMHSMGIYNSNWSLNVKSILGNSGLGYVWNSQNVLNKFDIKMFIKQILHDQCIHSWYSDINNSSRGHFYSSYKTDFVLEKYLINLKKCRRVQIGKVRC